MNKFEINVPEELHQDSVKLVCSFAEAMASKLRKSEIKYGYSNGWLTDDWADLARKELRNHLDKGDPLDVANYCAFLWYLGEPTCLKEDTRQAKFNALKDNLLKKIKEQDKLNILTKEMVDYWK